MLKATRLALCLVAAWVLSVALSQTAGADADGIRYVVLAGRAVVVGYDGDAAELTIPSSLNGYPVISIAPAAFKHNAVVSSVTLSEGIQDIGADAFMDCARLTRVTLPSTLTSLGVGCFRSARIESVSLPLRLTAIPAFAFADCAALAEIVLPPGIVKVGDEAFANCARLRRAYLTSATREFGRDVFADCLNIAILSPAGSAAQKYAAANGLPYASPGEPYAYRVLLNQARIMRYLGDAEQLVVPDQLGGYPVGAVEERAFAGNGRLRSVALPATVGEIDEEAFAGCAALESLSFAGGSSLKDIGVRAFAGCAALTDVRLPDGLLRIGDQAFENALSLSSIPLPDSIEVIGRFAFAHCRALEAISLPQGLTAISVGLFFDCASLSDVRWPVYSTYVGENAFYGCAALQALAPPDGVAAIGPRAFYGCAALRVVSLPDSLRSVAEGAFRECPLLSQLALPSAVDEIGEGILPPDATIVSWPGSYARSYADANGYPFLSSLDYRVNGDEVTITGLNGNLATIEIPDRIEGLPVTEIQPGAFVGRRFARAFAVPEGSARFSAPGGALLSADGARFICFPPGGPGGAYSLPEGVTAVAPGAFSGCDQLTEVFLPRAVSDIGQAAFEGCAPTLYGYGEPAEGYAAAAGLDFVPLPSSIRIIPSVEGNEVLYSQHLTLAIQPEPAGAYLGPIAYASDNPASAEVAPDGAVTIRAPGTVTFRASAYGGVEHEVTLTLWPDYVGNRGIRLDNTAIVMSPNARCPLSVAEYEPADTTLRGAAWASANMGVARPDSAQGEAVVVMSGSKTGTTTITATSSSGYKATCKVTVKSIRASLNASSKTLVVGQRFQLKASYSPSAPTFAACAWTSTNPPVAQVDETGLVTALAEGTATIEARTAVNTTLRFAVKVARRVESIALTGKNAMASGVTISLSASVAPANAYNRGVKYMSSDPKVARVDGSGRVTAFSVSRATEVTITAVAADGGGAASAAHTITVYPRAQSIKLFMNDEPVTSTITLYLSSAPTARLTAEVSPSSAYQGVWWKLGSSSAVSIDADGLLTARAVGTTTLTVTSNDGANKSAKIKIVVKAG